MEPETSQHQPGGRKKAIAVRYDQDKDSAPVVVAKGSGLLAEKIMALADEHNIPLYEDPDLVEILATVDLGQSIPAEMYQAMAEVLAFVYRMNGSYKK